MTICMDRMESDRNSNTEAQVTKPIGENAVRESNKESTISILPRFMTIKQWVSAFGYIPEGGLRHLLFTNESFNRKVAKRVGRKVLLDVPALEAWIIEQNNEPQATTFGNREIA